MKLVEVRLKSGLTCGEIRIKSVVKRGSTQLDLSFVSSCFNIFDTLDLAKLDQTQKDALAAELQKLRNSVDKNLNILGA